MISFFKKLLFENWIRKLIALILAVVIWTSVNHSMSINKNFYQVPVKIINLPKGKTIEGLQANNILQQRINLSLTGNKNILDNLGDLELEIVVDASGKPDEWSVKLTQQNLLCLQKDINLSKYISKVSHTPFTLRLANLITEKISVFILKPVGEAPQGFQFVDVWPSELYVTVSGPEEMIKNLKSRGLKLRFNLNNITAEELEALRLAQKNPKDEVSYYIPSSWKRVNIPYSNTPMEIDDPRSAFLKMDFIQKELLPLKASVPISLFFPMQYSDFLNPENSSLQTGNFVKEKNGLFYIKENLFVQGVSLSFLESVQNMIEVVIVAMPKDKRDYLPWYVQFVSPQDLEDIYITKVLSEAGSTDANNLNPQAKEEYLRSHFRNYMTSFRLYLPTAKKLALKIRAENNKIVVTPQEALKK